MRHTTRPLIGMLLAAMIGSNGLAAEEKAPWWHFGMGDKSSSQVAAAAPAPATPTPSPAITPVEDESWLHWPSMPKTHWFGSSAADEQSSRVARPRNTWAQQPASSSDAPKNASPWQTVKTGTSTAWHKTVDFVTPGDSSPKPTVASAPKEPWWKRMWGSDEPAEQKGPRTVTEWMAQDRIDP